MFLTVQRSWPPFGISSRTRSGESVYVRTPLPWPKSIGSKPAGAVARLRSRVDGGQAKRETVARVPTATEELGPNPLKTVPFYPGKEDLLGQGTTPDRFVRLGESDAVAPVLNGPRVLAST